MNLREYLSQLKQFVQDHPEALDYQVIYSRDDEGNGYQRVYFSPSLGHFDGDYEFYQLKVIQDDPEEYEDEYGVSESDMNAVCIN